MRSLPITALLILAAFVLGLALGGQTPREATAQEELPEIGWEIDGDSLILVNNTEEKGFFVRGSLLPGSESKVPPAFTEGIVEVSTNDVSGVTVFGIHPILECDGAGCRACDDAPTLCEMPPRPLPLTERAFLSTMGRRWNQDY